jgi:hypothetical protein
MGPVTLDLLSGRNATPAGFAISHCFSGACLEFSAEVYTGEESSRGVNFINLRAVISRPLRREERPA